MSKYEITVTNGQAEYNLKNKTPQISPKDVSVVVNHSPLEDSVLNLLFLYETSWENIDGDIEHLVSLDNLSAPDLVALGKHFDLAEIARGADVEVYQNVNDWYNNADFIENLLTSGTDDESFLNAVRAAYLGQEDRDEIKEEARDGFLQPDEMKEMLDPEVMYDHFDTSNMVVLPSERIIEVL